MAAAGPRTRLNARSVAGMISPRGNPSGALGAGAQTGREAREAGHEPGSGDARESIIPASNRRIFQSGGGIMTAMADVRFGARRAPSRRAGNGGG
jgi:hypothetical protein